MCWAKTLVMAFLLASSSHVMADKYIDESEKADERAHECDVDPECRALVRKMKADRERRSEAAEKAWNDHPIEKTMDVFLWIGLAGGLLYYFFFREGPKPKE
jgi:hypothetical protein